MSSASDEDGGPGPTERIVKPERPGVLGCEKWNRNLIQEELRKAKRHLSRKPMDLVSLC